MAARGSKITPAVRAAFNEIIGSPGIAITSALINQLKYKDLPTPKYYSDAATTLPALTCRFEDDPYRPEMQKGVIGGDPVTQIGGGAYGTIFLGNSGKAYKRTIKKVDKDIEDFHKELFMEPFIQTLLQNDAKYGMNIAKLMGVYRDAGAVAASTRARGTVSATGARGTAPMRESNYTYYYVMEPIAYTVDTYIAQLANPLEFIDKLRDIGEILNYFKTNYGFYHCDLHGGNILFNYSKSIKIIDFGMSCITDAGTVYSLITKTCHAWDLLLYITYLKQNNVIPIFNNLFDKLLSHGANNLYNIVYNSSECPGDNENKIVTWAMYNWQMDDPIDGPRGVWIAADTRTEGMSLIRFFNTYLSFNFRPIPFSDYWRRVREDLDAGNNGTSVNTPAELELAAAPMGTLVTAPTLMRMNNKPTRGTIARTTKCCSGGLCGLCGGKRFLRKSMSKRFLRKHSKKHIVRKTRRHR
jgi:serine/threonine protein kinase